MAASALAMLVSPSTAETFLTEVWEQRWSRYRPKPGLGWLIGAGDMPALIAAHRAAEVKPITLCRIFRGAYQEAMACTAAGDVDPGAIHDAWRGGFTVIVPELHRFWRPAIAFSQALQNTAGLRAEINLYYTPPGGVAFPPHYDTHDVFALQIFGAKVWGLYRSPKRLPYPEERFDPARVRSGDLDSPLVETTLTMGDVLYLPRGTVHAARSVALPSLHLSLGIYPALWRDIVTERPDQAVIGGRDPRCGVSPEFWAHPSPEHAPGPIGRSCENSAPRRLP
jgi:hypothetical protein